MFIISLKFKIIDEIPPEENASKSSIYNPGNSLFEDCKNIDDTAIGSNVTQNHVYNQGTSLFEECKENDSDLDANDFDDYPMESASTQIYPVNTSNQYYQVTSPTVSSVPNPTYVVVNNDNTTRKRLNPSNRSKNANPPQSSSPSTSRVPSTKPYYRQLPQSQTPPPSRSTRYNNTTSFNNRSFQNYTSNAKQNQNFDLERELKEIDEMNDAIDKLF
uniref:Reverse transcriptase domain-containing protein n=1 Tax=Strongyloides venezuelensis TaxID=75913 RepID=A0A0K0G3Q6_STRVS